MNMQNLMLFIGDFLVDCALILAYLIGSIVVAGLILGAFKNLICQYMQYAMGYTGILITAWIGTPIHELGHAIMCWVFHHKVIEVKLFNPDKESGVLGYVNHSYDPRSIYQKIGNFFIGIAPIVGGTLVITLLMAVMLPTECHQMVAAIKDFQWPTDISFDSIMMIKDSIISLFVILFTKENMKSIVFWIFIYLAISISSHMALSTADLKGASSGIGVMYLVIVVVNILVRVLHLNLKKVFVIYYLFNSYFITMLIIALFCSLCSLLFSLLLYSIKTSMR